MVRPATSVNPESSGGGLLTRCGSGEVLALPLAPLTKIAGRSERGREFRQLHLRLQVPVTPAAGHASGSLPASDTSVRDGTPEARPRLMHAGVDARSISADADERMLRVKRRFVGTSAGEVGETKFPGSATAWQGMAWLARLRWGPSPVPTTALPSRLRQTALSPPQLHLPLSPCPALLW